MKHKKLKMKKGLALTPMALTLAACGGEKVTNPNPFGDSDDNSKTTAVVLDYYTGASGYHGDFVESTLKEATTVEVVGVDRTSSKVSDTDKELERVDSLHEPEVINMSTGTSQIVTDRGVTQSGYQNITDTSLELFYEGTYVVAAAGNEGAYGVSSSRGVSVFQLAVGATGGDGELTSYTNYHPKEVDFYADGTSAPTEYTTNSGAVYVLTLQGTSFSSPTVAGYVSELLDFDPTYSYSEIRTLLEYNSEYLVHDGPEGSFVYQHLDGIDTADHVIDTRVIVEAGFELFDGRNPEQMELDTWVDSIYNGDSTYDDLQAELEGNDINLDNVADIELAQAHFHWNYHRESTDEELLAQLLGMEEDLTYAQVVLPPEEIQIIATPESLIA